MQSLDTDTERTAAAAMASAEEFEAEEEMIVEDDEMALLNEGERSSRRRDPSYGGLRKSELVSTWRQVKEIVIEVSITSAVIRSETEQSMSTDSTDSPSNNSGLTLYWGALGPCFGIYSLVPIVYCICSRR